MGTCISKLPSGSNPNQCCGVVRQVRDLAGCRYMVERLCNHLIHVLAASCARMQGANGVSGMLSNAYCAMQTLQNANSLSGQAGTSTVFSSALASYPRVQACQQSN